jgi:alanine-glyoxylate transaminase / (R)-3-amino-2-methylpropionate-pyruvate transaminase
MTTMAPSRPSIPPHDHTPRPYTGPSRQEVLAMRRQYCHPSTFLYYREPLMVVEGHMQYLYDETGRRYLDFFAGIVTVSCGHSHPRFLERLQAQLVLIQHTTTIYLHPNFPLMARRLAGKMPPGLEVTYFVNSGSEANDLAILMARMFTGNNDVIAVRNSYHGGSPSAMALTSHATWKFPAQLNHGVHHAVSPDPYRSPFRGTPEEIASRSAADIRDLVRYSTPGRVAAFIAEPIQGVGGTTLGAPNYLREAYAITREYGGLCIADEVQTGFGRTGDHFWGFEESGVVPDIVTMAKGIGNGLPLAAVTTSREIAEALTQRIHFNTFGGNPLSMAAGLAVLDIIEEDGLQENARVTGARLKAGLHELMTRHRLIGDVRGRGLMVGVELVLDRETKEPATRETLAVWEAAREMGLLIGKGGLDGNVLRIKPPMCITAADVDFALEVLDEALERTERTS